MALKKIDIPNIMIVPEDSDILEQSALLSEQNPESSSPRIPLLRIIPCIPESGHSDLSTAVSAVDEQAETPQERIAAFLEESGLVLLSKEEPFFKGVEYLAGQIASAMPDASDFLHSLRIANSNSGEFSYSMKKCSEAQKGIVSNLAGLMKQCGIFTEFITTSSCLKGKISSAGRVINFINGKWLEIHFQCVTADIVKHYAEQYHLPYEVFTNVVVETTAHTERHEIDCMFSIGDIVFGTEQKTGSLFSDYDKYREIGEYLHIVPDRFLLLNSALEDSNTIQCIRYFYQYYVCGLSAFHETIHEMIQKAFQN